MGSGIGPPGLGQLTAKGAGFDIHQSLISKEGNARFFLEVNLFYINITTSRRANAYQARINLASSLHQTRINQTRTKLAPNSRQTRAKIATITDVDDVIFAGFCGNHSKTSPITIEDI